MVSWKNRNQVQLVQEKVIEVDECRFKRVDHFKSLGSIIIQDNDLKAKISMRLKSANKCFYCQSKIFRSRAISQSQNLNVRMYLLNFGITNCLLCSRRIMAFEKN